MLKSQADLKNLLRPRPKKIPPKDNVEMYSKAGYALFKLNGKRPASTDNWRKTPVNRNLTILDLPGNFGLVIPAGVLIIDVDCKDGQAGKESYRQLKEDTGLVRGWEKETFMVKTGSGGFHIYLKKDPAVKIRKNLKEYPGIDFLSVGCYVVGAGSIHPDTSLRYEAVFGSPNERMIPAPAPILKKIEKTQVVEQGNIEENFVDDDPLNIERFVELLHELPGAESGARHQSCYIAACRGRDLGISKDRCLETILTEYADKLKPSLGTPVVAQVVRSVYTYAQGVQGAKNVSSIFKTVQMDTDEDLQNLHYDVNAKKQLRPTLNNAVNYLLTLPGIAKAFSLNTFTGNIEISSSVPWFKQRGNGSATVCDEDISLLKYHLSRVMALEFTLQTLHDAIVVVGHKRHYHPIRNYLSELVWDRIPRLDTWLTTYGGAIDTPYTRAIGRKVLCAAVNRVFVPGCKWDYVLIIEGKQGIGKSTACRILGRMWGGDMNLDPHSKDAVAMMGGKWVIELSEMVALKWSDAAALKSFITREKDTVRPAYARHARDFLRQSIFIGTVNPDHVGYLHDVTGNRRFWVVNFPKMVDMVGLEQNCSQLWAEATYYYKTEPLFLAAAEEQMQEVETKARMPEDPMTRQVKQYIEEYPEITELDVVEVMDFLGISATRANKNDQSRVALILGELGCTRERVTTGGHMRHIFRRKDA